MFDLYSSNTQTHSLKSHPLKEMEKSSFREFKTGFESFRWGAKSYTLWNFTLSPEERVLVTELANHRGGEINNYLRQRSSGPSDDASLAIAVHTLSQALQKTKVPENIVVYIGYNVNHMNHFILAMEGQTLTDKCFFTGSLLPPEHSDVVMKIKVPANIRAAFVGTFVQDELTPRMLFDKGQTIFVNKVTRQDDKTWLDCHMKWNG